MSSRPLGFVPFLDRVCRVNITPAQRVLALVSFDGVEPGDLSTDDRQLARAMFGDVERFPPLARAVCAWVKGARAGGSWLAALRLLHAALVTPLEGLAAGERASAIAVAPDQRLSRVLVRYVAGACTTPELAPLVVATNADSVIIRRPHDGKEVAIEALPASGAGASAVRGRTFVAAALDESAFFPVDGAATPDSELFAAIAPRVVPSGIVHVLSTPWAPRGLLFDLFQRNHGAPQDAIAARVPTALARGDDERIRAVLERERIRDGKNYLREFCCEWLSVDQFFDETSLAACVDHSRPLSLPPEAGGLYALGIDLGFARDASAAAIVRVRDDRVVDLAYLDEVRPQNSVPLSPTAVLGRVAELATRYKCEVGVADSFGFAHAREVLGASGIDLQAAPTGTDHAKMHLHARDMMREGRVRLPDDDRLLAQLRSLTSTPRPGGGLRIEAPRSRRGGGHADSASSLIAALWAARTVEQSGFGDPFGGGPITFRIKAFTF